MTTYFLTWAIVCILAIMAQSTDYSENNSIEYDRIIHTRQTKFFIVLATSVLVFVAGFRYYIGSDYYAYYGWYKYYATTVWERIVSLDEPGIRIIYWIVVKIIDNPVACIFTTNAIMICLVIRILYRNAQNIGVAVILYSLVCWTATFNGMRQALAVAVLFCGFPYIKHRKLFKFAIVVFLAFLCHRSAIIMLALYFVVHRKINAKNIVLIIIISSLLLRSYSYIFNITSQILEEEIESTHEYTARTVNVLRVASNVLPAIIFLRIYWNRIKDSITILYLNMLIVHATLAIVTSNSAFLARITMFTAPFEILSLSELSKDIEERNRSLLIFLMVLSFFIFQSYEVYHSADLSPFRWIWSR